MKRDVIMKLLEAGGAIHEALAEACAPMEANRHFRASRAEALKGLRSLLDAEIGRLESRAAAKPQEKASKRSVGRTIDITE
ncbi:hypothetical protein [Paenibacillus sp. GYB003]|uniref:hypothetical protein n=1 Tax=Paenibacillus sp. GYB003 TaxID=2994392 RepID=UPI002F9673F2